jgi:hypothetical protein
MEGQTTGFSQKVLVVPQQCWVISPALRQNSSGRTWNNQKEISMHQAYIGRGESDPGCEVFINGFARKLVSFTTP